MFDYGRILYAADKDAIENTYSILRKTHHRAWLWQGNTLEGNKTRIMLWSAAILMNADRVESLFTSSQGAQYREWIMQQSHPEWFFLDTHSSIDEIRTMRAQCSQAVSYGHERIIFLSHVDSYSQEAQSSILKMIEEPLSDTRIMMTASHNPLPTLISRVIVRRTLPLSFSLWQESLCNIIDPDLLSQEYFFTLCHACPVQAILLKKEVWLLCMQGWKYLCAAQKGWITLDETWLQSIAVHMHIYMQLWSIWMHHTMIQYGTAGHHLIIWEKWQQEMNLLWKEFTIYHMDPILFLNILHGKVTMFYTRHSFHG